MNWRVINAIFRKEMLDTLRDRRTLIMMIGAPLVLYPALMLVSLQVILYQHEALEQTVARVAVTGQYAEPVRAWVRDFSRVTLVAAEDPPRALRARAIDAYIVVERPIETLLAAGRTAPIVIHFDSTEHASREAAARLEAGLESVRQSIRAQRLDAAAIAPEYIQPLSVARRDAATPAETTGAALGLLLPMLMVLMIALGAFYPAIDLTAGEKERGTFETLLSAPISKYEIVAGKFITVFLLAMFTGLLNLGSMAAAIALMLHQVQPLLEEGAALEIRFSPGAFLIVLAVTVPLAFFICAAMMSIAVFARSFKEAQNYMTPFFLVILFPALVAAIPGVALDAFTQFIPIANVILLFKELLLGRAAADAIFAVFASTLVFAASALLFAGWLFQREEVVLAEDRGVPLGIHRRNLRPRDALTPGLALGLFCFLLLNLFYGGSLLQQWHLFAGVAVTQWGLLLLPTLALLWYARIRPRTALYLAAPSPRGMAGAVLLGAGCVVLLLQAAYWQQQVLPMPEELAAQFEALFAPAEGFAGLAALLFVAALTPAICEEAIFRGALFSGLRERLRPGAAIMVTALLFGLFHLSIYRLAPTTLMGVILGYIVYRTGSIYPAMLAHFLFNATAILLATGHVPDIVANTLDLARIEAEGLPPALVAAGLALTLAGLVLIGRGPKR